MDRGAWWAIVHETAKELDTTERLNNKQLYKAACPWTPKQLSLPEVLKHPVKFSDSRPEAIKESFFFFGPPHPPQNRTSFVILKETYR